MFQSLISWLVTTVGSLGYPGIVILMALESSFFPFPSEVVMIPAGYLAYLGAMNIFLVIATGIIGSIVGALVNYWIAVHLGRRALLRWGHYFFLSTERFIQVEEYLRRHGDIGTFIGRLIPVVRQYISFPAGLARMPMGRFVFFTSLGAGLWVGILAAIGYMVGDNEELVRAWSQTALFWVVIGCGLLVLIYRKLR